MRVRGRTMRWLPGVLLIVAAGITGSIGHARAADIAVPPLNPAAAAPPPPYSPPAYSWTGFYIGGNAGWSWTQYAETIATSAASGSASGNGKGFVGGGQIGFNWQVIQPLVIGAEADLQGTTSRGSIRGSVGPALITGDPRSPFFGTVRGRIGFVYERWMIYATAGGAFGQNTFNGTSSVAGAFTSSSNFTTWTAGGGFEFALGGHFTAKLEYLYLGAPSSVPVPAGASTVSASTHTSLARAGINYRF